MIVRDDPTGPWKRLGDPVLCATDESIDVDTSPESSIIGVKRALSPSNSDIPDPKRARGISQAPARPSDLCLAPKPNSAAQRIITNRDTPIEASLGTGDIFLTENFRERWCRCTSVSMPTSTTQLVSCSVFSPSVCHHLKRILTL
jgi:E3 ubiquitin-protein ligase UBR7